MQRLIIIILVSLISVLAEANEIRVVVRGMVCGFCVQGIDKKISSNPFVKKVDVDLDNQLVTIQLKEGASLSDETIGELVRDAGFTPEKIHRD